MAVICCTQYVFIPGGRQVFFHYFKTIPPHFQGVIGRKFAGLMKKSGRPINNFLK